MALGSTLLACTLGLFFAHGAVQMPAWFSVSPSCAHRASPQRALLQDNMVLQANAEYGARSFLSGRAAPGETVHVNVTGIATVLCPGDGAV